MKATERGKWIQTTFPDLSEIHLRVCTMETGLYIATFTYSVQIHQGF